MKKIRFLSLALCAVFTITFPTGPAPMASSDAMLKHYIAYPVPNGKPQQCVMGEVQYETDLSKKQAAAAALGLYFGVKHANAPQLRKEKMAPYICI